MLRRGGSSEQLLEHIPETEPTGVTRTIVRDGRVVAEVRAERVWTWILQGGATPEQLWSSEADGGGACRQARRGGPAPF